MATAVVTATPRRNHRVLVPALLTVATVIGFLACFAVWVNRQVLNTSNWTKTTNHLISDPHVEAALSRYLSNELFSVVNVEERLRSALPSQLRGLSGPLSAGVRELAERAVPRLLASPRVLAVWERANRAAHAEFLKIVNGGSRTVSTANGVVTLNVRELITDLAAQLGLSSQLAAARSKIPESARSKALERVGVSASGGQIVLMRSRQLRAVQDIVKGVKGLAILLPLLSLGMLALAVWLAHGRRRVTMRSAGWCLFGIGVVVLVARRVAGAQAIEQLVADPVNKAAAEAAWSIGTVLLYDIAVALLGYGLVVVIAAWLGGGTRPAAFLRRAWAPWLRDHPVGAYAVAAVLLMLVVLWGPTPATRQLLPVLGFAVLLAIGVAVLRRETEREFPNARHGEAVALLRDGWRRRGQTGAASSAAPQVGAPGADAPGANPAWDAAAAASRQARGPAVATGATPEPGSREQ